MTCLDSATLLPCDTARERADAEHDEALAIADRLRDMAPALLPFPRASVNRGCVSPPEGQRSATTHRGHSLPRSSEPACAAPFATADPAGGRAGREDPGAAPGAGSADLDAAGAPPSPPVASSSHPRFCDAFIDHPTDWFGGSYCKLLAGHAGEHSAHYPPAAA